jgi:Polyketide cyclase / dehydrase and lipid transport
MTRLRTIGCAVVAGIGCTSLAWAATIRSLDVTRHHGRYALVADTFLNAPAEAIYDVLVDYDQFNRISSVYKEFGYLEPDEDGTPIVYTRMEGCLAFFCKSMRRVERLETREPYYIRTVTLPEQSDFEYSVSEWVLEPEHDGTKVTYRLEMEPDFWVPPVVGPWYLKRTLMHGGTNAVNRIERLARSLEEGDGTGDSAGTNDAPHGGH